MKQCLICGCIDEAGDVKTCPKCGEATWRRIASVVETVTEALQEVSPDAPRRRGRPRKNES